MGRSALAALAATAALGVPATAAAQTLISFRTPSGNIGCIYNSSAPGDPAALRCDIRSRLRHPPPARPRGCNLDWGDSLFMHRTGGAILTCHGDTAIDSHARVLAYGKRWVKDGFTCASQAIGLRCANRSGHGFFLSRERWERF